MTFDNFFKRLYAKAPRRPNLSQENHVLVPKLIRNILNRCWQQKPELRPTAIAVLNELNFQLTEPEEAEGEEEGNQGRERDEEFVTWLPKVYNREE